MYLLLLPLYAVLIVHAVDGCEDGWLGHRGECYLFSHDLETWIGAMDICRLFGATLVEVETEDEDHFLVAQIGNLGNSFWIGLTDLSEEGTFKWMSSGDRLTSSSFNNWYPGNPSNSGHNENCVHYLTSTHGDGTIKWNDVPCASKQKYICEKESNPGSEIIG